MDDRDLKFNRKIQSGHLVLVVPLNRGRAKNQDFCLRNSKPMNIVGSSEMYIASTAADPMIGISSTDGLADELVKRMVVAKQVVVFHVDDVYTVVNRAMAKRAKSPYLPIDVAGNGCVAWIYDHQGPQLGCISMENAM